MGISYAEDLEKVAKIVKKAVQGVSERNVKKDIELFYTDFGDSSINFIVRFWILNATQLSYRFARSHAIVSIKKAFDKNGITIPFPIRTLDFGIKGGEKLSRMLK